SRGVKNVSPDDAFHFALEIVRRKHLTALAARRAKRDNWLYDNILEYKLDSSISTMSATAFSDVEKAQPVSVNTLLK
ncbi:MAG: hypothetical protein IJW08_10845, partial [Lentisphaeria bacterium]|nr:hypothetical protein [Lentisphaeria bacterium]